MFDFIKYLIINKSYLNNIKIMKKFILSIIILISILSTTNISKAEWLLDDILDISYWQEKLILDDVKLDSYNFYDSNLQKTYSKTIQVNDAIKERIMLLYRNWSYNRTQMSKIIDDYKTFIYYTNRMFYLKNLQEKYWYLKNDNDLKDSIIDCYKNMEIYYRYVNTYLKKISK